MVVSLQLLDLLRQSEEKYVLQILWERDWFGR